MIIVNILMVIINENGDVDYENYKFCNSNDD